MHYLVGIAFIVGATLTDGSRVSQSKNVSSASPITKTAPPVASNETASLLSHSKKEAAAPMIKATISSHNGTEKNSSINIVSKKFSTHQLPKASGHSAGTQSFVRRFHRTAQEELLDSEMKRAIRDASALTSDLQSVGHVSNMVLQQTEATRMEKKRLEDQLSADDTRLQAEAKIQAEKASLAVQLNKLSVALEEQRKETARQQSISTAVSTKVKMLEDNIRVMSKAWKEAAQHQAALVKAARSEEVDAQLEAAASAKLKQAKETTKAKKAKEATKAKKVVVAKAKAKVAKAVKVAKAAKVDKTAVKALPKPTVPWFTVAARESARMQEAESANGEEKEAESENGEETEDNSKLSADDEESDEEESDEDNTESDDEDSDDGTI
jgi:hypothetical protein